MAREHVELVERPGVEQVIDALAGEHLALLVLALDGALRTRVQGLVLASLEVFETFLHRMLRHIAAEAN